MSSLPARSVIALTKAVLPIPGSPRTSTTAGCPARAERTARSTVSSSADRPRSGRVPGRTGAVFLDASAATRPSLVFLSGEVRLLRMPVGVRAAKDQAGVAARNPAVQPCGERHGGGRLDGQ